jgi:hypothetical protein
MTEPMEWDYPPTTCPRVLPKIIDAEYRVVRQRPVVGFRLVCLHHRHGRYHRAPLRLGTTADAVRHARRHQRRRHAGRGRGARDLWGRCAACEA